MKLVLLVLCILPIPTVIEHHVDVLELNHFYDENGRHVFDQYIYWGWNGEDFEIIDWRLAKTKHQIPHGNIQYFIDNERVKKIIFKSYRETWTQEDVELIERQKLPTENRRKL